MTEAGSTRVSTVTTVAAPADVWMTGPRVHVRPLRDTDVGPQYASWFEDPEIRRFIKYARQAPSIADLRAYRAQMDARPDVDFLGIFLNDDGGHIGNLKFETGPASDEMHVGFLIGDPDWRRAGILTEILPPCIERVLRARRLRRLYLTVDPLNAAGIRAFTKLGFLTTATIDRNGDLEMDYAGPDRRAALREPPVAMLDQAQGTSVRVELDGIGNRGILDTLVERYYRSEMAPSELSSHCRLLSPSFQVDSDADGRLVAARGAGLGVVHWNSSLLQALDRICIASHSAWLGSHELTRMILVARRVCDAMALQLTMDVFRQVCTAVLLQQRLAGHVAPKLLMIGDGYGVLSSLMKSVYPVATIVAVDLGRTLLFQAYLNQRAHAKASHALAGDPGWAHAEFVYCPSEQIDMLRDLRFDAAVNIASMQQMTAAQVGKYFSFLRQTLKPDNLFYCCNRERKELVGGEVSEFRRYPWGSHDRVLIDEVCPWHRYFLSVTRIAGVPLPIVRRYDGRVLHRLAVMAVS